MIIYFIVFLLLVLISAKDFIQMSSVNNLMLSILTLILLICFFGFRYECDNDYDNYVGIYNSTPSLSHGLAEVAGYGVLVGVEVGYCTISALFKMFDLGAQSIFIFSAIITFTLIYKAFQIKAIYPGLAMLIYFSQFFSLPFIQMRFGIAMSIVLIACIMLFANKKRYFWLLILFGTLFHTCALGGIAVFFFYKIDWHKKPLLIWTTIFVSLILMLMPMRSVLVGLLGSIGIDKYTKLYADTESASPISVLVTMILVIPLILYKNNLKEKGVEVNQMFSMSLASIFVGCLVWQLGILNRFSMITAVSLCMIIPSYLLLLKTRQDKLVGIVLIVAYCFFKFLPSINHVTEYQTFFAYAK